MLRKSDYYAKRLGLFLIMAALIAGMVGCDSNTSPNPQIRTWYDLDAVRNNLAGNYTLMNDLDSTTPGYNALAGPTANQGWGWDPIGTAIDAEFTGTFDGQGHEIHDLFINRPRLDYGVGLFGAVGQNGVIKNIGVTNATVIGQTCVGGLVGFSHATVTNSYFSGSVTGNNGVGGLMGVNGGTLNNSYATGNVTGYELVGGLMGCNFEGTVSNSYSTVNVAGDYSVGGLMGLNKEGTVSNSYSTVSNSYSSGNVTGLWSVGGLLGANEGTVSNSYSSGNVTGYTGTDCPDCMYIGGLVGRNSGTVDKSYSTGSVTGLWSVGGLLGANEGTVSNSYYNHAEVLINCENLITIGALFDEDFKEWLANNKSLDVNGRLSQESGYYLVNNVSDFKQLLAFGQNASLKFKLTSDLDLATEPNFYIPYFAGEFDGNGHKISNLSFNFDFVDDVGLFGYLAPSGKVTQVGVENVNITGDDFVGGLVGWNAGSVSDSYFTGSVNGDTHAGGLVGTNSGTVSNSYSTGNVTGTSYVGGLVGVNYGTVSNSYSTSSVTSDHNVGGLVGFNFEEAIVSNSYSNGNVTGGNFTGGLVGSNDGTVSNSYSTGSVTGNSDVGGLVGLNYYGTVSNSFWDIQTSGRSTSAGGTGKTTAQMKDIATFSDAGWSITGVALNETNPAYIWNIVNNVTYPFLSWQP